MIQNLKMLNRSSLISFGFSFMLLLSFKAEAEAQNNIFGSDENMEGVKAFLEKREPDFK